jgi:lipoprotein-anchoring transpeptidase ErfK/SrfK
LLSLAQSQDPVVESQLTGAFDTTDTIAFFHGSTYTSPLSYPSIIPPAVLGTTTNKRIEVNLTTQHLTAFQDNVPVLDFPVSTGKWGRTPTGTFKVWIKLVSTKMSGGSKALGTYYYLPNVPYTMYFYNDEIPKSRGYGIHGAYWHDNFGQPMSHGCVNVSPENAQILFYWADPTVTGDQRLVYTSEENPSTPIVIYGTAAES